MRHARWRVLTSAKEAEAIAEPIRTAGGRTDLLAQHAGLPLAFHDQGIEAPLHRQAAGLCIKAGADGTDWISGPAAALGIPNAAPTAPSPI